MTTKGPKADRVPHTHPPSRPPEPRRGRLTDQRVTLAVTGSIAAYKSVLLARLLVSEGATVEVLFTRSAAEFVGAPTFAGITGQKVLTDMFDANVPGELHIDVAARSRVILIVPATADMIARLANGRADDLVTATALSATCPVVIAPAMHPNMWNHPATQRNIATLASDGRIARVGPVYGEVASGERGVGRMAEPEEILSALLISLAAHDLSGRHIVVSAGPTVEDIDPVRFISNRSSGKMGFALAERAAARGARVTLVSGPVTLSTPAGVQRVDVRSAIAMRGAIWQAMGPDLSHADALIMAAAVGDFRPAETHQSKLKRASGGDGSRLDLVQNADILSEVGHARKKKLPVLIGFAVETDSDEKVVALARGKLTEKRVDIVVANHASDSLGRDDNRVTLVQKDKAEPLARLNKVELADHVLDWLVSRLAEHP